MAISKIINNRFKAALGLLIVFLMILATNKIDDNQFAFVQESFESIYKDRLVVDNHILNIS